jgi:hypothetical protein
MKAPKYLSLPKGYVVTVYSTNFQTEISGITKATQDRFGKVTIFYSNNETVSRGLPKLDLSIYENLLDIEAIVKEKKSKKVETP